MSRFDELPEAAKTSPKEFAFGQEISAQKPPNHDETLSLNDVALVQTNDVAVEQSNDSDESSGNKISPAVAIDVSADETIEYSTAIISDDDIMPIYESDADLSIEFATSIEIRGPPAYTADSLTTSNLIAYAISDEIAESSIVESTHTLTAPELPGLVLVDPDISSLNGQIIYLDFDGAEGVIYNGPVTIGPFDVPAFEAPAELAGQEDLVISEILSELEKTFAGTGIIFTLEQPPAGAEYSTIYVGGDNAAFSQYGSFLGLAEQVDVGNTACNDEGWVFSEQLAGGSVEVYAAMLSEVVAHEVGHLVGYKHSSQSTSYGALDNVAESGTLYANPYSGNVPIQDNGGWDGRAIWQTTLSGAPSGARITDVDVFYDIDHTFVGDLRVWLATERGGTWYNNLLFNHGGDPNPEDDDLDRTHTGLDDWDGLDPNGTWYLIVADDALGDVGHIEEWEIWVDWATFDPYFWDARITNKVDQDSDGYASSFDIEFDVDSNMAGNYYVKVYEYDWGLPDDYLTTSGTFSVNGSDADYHSVHINCSDYPGFDLLSHGTAEFRLDLYDAATNTLKQTWYPSDDSDLNNVNVELSSQEIVFILSVDPDVISAGSSQIVTITVRNGSDTTQDFLILAGSQPEGWIIEALQDKNTWGDCNPEIPANSIYEATFKVTHGTGDGMIRWELREDRWTNPLLDTYDQAVSIIWPEMETVVALQSK